MSRLCILTQEEIKTFDKPPRFSLEQRQKYFYLSDKLIPLLQKLRYGRYSGQKGTNLYFSVINSFFCSLVGCLATLFDFIPSLSFMTVELASTLSSSKALTALSS